MVPVEVHMFNQNLVVTRPRVFLQIMYLPPQRDRLIWLSKDSETRDKQDTPKSHPLQHLKVTHWKFYQYPVFVWLPFLLFPFSLRHYFPMYTLGR